MGSAGGEDLAAAVRGRGYGRTVVLAFVETPAPADAGRPGGDVVLVHEGDTVARALARHRDRVDAS